MDIMDPLRDGQGIKECRTERTEGGNIEYALVGYARDHLRFRSLLFSIKALIRCAKCMCHVSVAVFSHGYEAF